MSKPFFALFLAAALAVGIAACNTNGGIPAIDGGMNPPGSGASPSAKPSSSPTNTTDGRVRIASHRIQARRHERRITGH